MIGLTLRQIWLLRDARIKTNIEVEEKKGKGKIRIFLSDNKGYGMGCLEKSEGTKG